MGDIDGQACPRVEPRIGTAGMEADAIMDQFPLSIKEVTVTFASNIACLYFGVFYVKQPSSKEDFSKNHGFGAISPPYKRAALHRQVTITFGGAYLEAR